MVKRRITLHTVPTSTGATFFPIEQPVERKVRKSSFQAFQPDICPFRVAQPLVAVENCGLCHGSHAGRIA